MSALVVRDGPGAGERYELEGELTLGRENTAVMVEDAEVSRRHAVIRPKGDGLEIEDLGSLNGTFVNGRKIESATRLSGGDVVKLGTTSFEIESNGRSGSPAAAAESAGTPSEPFSSSEEAEGTSRLESRKLTPALLAIAAAIAIIVALLLYLALG
ncbi:MAG: FHA domain-containing protein [Gaiellaceae bacterium]